MLRQIVFSILIIGAAFFGWVYFVPSAVDTLEEYGIILPEQLRPRSAVTTDAGAGPSGARTQQAANQPAGNQQAESRLASGPQRPGGFGGSRAAAVVTQPVVLATINDGLTTIGDGAAVRSVTVTAPSGGTLEELLVTPGDMVAAGDVIGRLDADAQQIAFEKASLAAKAADEAMARMTSLANSNSVSTAQVNTAQVEADTAKLELRNAELALQQRSIVSPISGRVGLMQVTPGNVVNAQTAVTTIEDSSEILVTFWVPERYAPEIVAGMPVSVAAVALPGQTFEGAVYAVDNRVDSASRTLQVQALVPNAEGRIRPGMSFSINLRFAGEQFPAVNPLAIQWSADGSYVWGLEDGKAKKIMAQIVQRNSDGVLVEGDLEEGQPIITEGVLQLAEGTEVTVLGADTQQRPAASQPQGRQGAPAERTL